MHPHAAFRPSLIDAIFRRCVTLFDQLVARCKGLPWQRSTDTPPIATRYGRDCPWCGYACDVVRSLDRLGLHMGEVVARCMRCSYMHFRLTRFDAALDAAGVPRPNTDWIDGLAAAEHRREFPDDTKEYRSWSK